LQGFCIKFGFNNNAILNDKSNNILSDAKSKKYTFASYTDAANKSKPVDIPSKLRMTLIQGREDDEPMTQVLSR
jgi:hypothetical protein